MPLLRRDNVVLNDLRLVDLFFTFSPFCFLSVLHFPPFLQLSHSLFFLSFLKSVVIFSLLFLSVGMNRHIESELMHYRTQYHNFHLFQEEHRQKVLLKRLYHRDLELTDCLLQEYCALLFIISTLLNLIESSQCVVKAKQKQN